MLMMFYLIYISESVEKETFQTVRFNDLEYAYNCAFENKMPNIAIEKKYEQICLKNYNEYENKEKIKNSAKKDCSM